MLSGLTLESVVAVESPTDVDISAEGMAPLEGKEGELRTGKGSYQLQEPSLFLFHINSNAAFRYSRCLLMKLGEDRIRYVQMEAHSHLMTSR